MRVIKICILLVILVNFHGFSLTFEEILSKNIQAVGGKERLSEICNLSIKVGDSTFYSVRDGRMKVVKGKKPACLEVLIVEKNCVKRSSIKGVKEIDGVERMTSVFQAKLFSGIFTLLGFGKELKYNGVKNFGMKSFHEFSTNIESWNFSLYIDNEDFLLKRAVLSFLTPEKEKQEINYDFSPYFDNGGVKIPSSWFVSRVGARGNLYEVEEVKFNEMLSEQFFNDFSLNIGNVEILSGELKGNILDFYERDGRIFIVSNWTSECFEKADIGTGDNVIIKIMGKDFEFNFYKNVEEARKEGALQRGNILSKLPDSDFYTLFISRSIDIREGLQILFPIELKKKKEEIK